MRSIITFLLLSFCFNTYAQKSKKINNLVVLVLYQAVDTTKIHNVLNILAPKERLYHDLFDYIPSINPLNPKKQKLVTSRFGRHFHPIKKKIKPDLNTAFLANRNDITHTHDTLIIERQIMPHLGLDFSAKKGTPIHASAAGVVVKVISSKSGYGHQVIIKHDYGFSTSYAQMHSFIVKKNDTITKGQIIGYVDDTGLNTKPLLHYEILKNNKAIDPYPFCFLNLRELFPDYESFKSNTFDSNMDYFLSERKKTQF